MGCNEDIVRKKLIAQMIKFGIVGAVAFAIDYGLLMLLSQIFGVDPVAAAAVSFTVSVIFNYFASMRYVFTRREGRSKTTEFTLFLILSVVGLGINELCMWGGIAVLGTSPAAISVVKVAATGQVMIWNFVSRKTWLDA